MSKPIYVLNGPNLNLLGEREPQIYGHATLEDIKGLCEARAAAKGRQVVFRQSNREGELIEWVQEARKEACAVVINAAGYGHTSVSLHDALRTLSIPVIDCHLSYVSMAASGVVSGFGPASYELAIEAACGLAAD